MSTLRFEGLREYFIATTYGQAVTQLSILKYVQRLESSTVSTAPNRRKSSSSSSTSLSRNSSMYKLRLNNEVLPSEKVLNGIKLEKELSCLIEIYTLAFDALSNPQTGVLLFKKAIEERYQNNNKVTLLQQQLKTHKIELRSLKSQIEVQRQDGQHRLELSSESIAELQHKLKHVRRINNLEFDLVIKWEESRCAQATIVCEKQENALSQQSALLRRKIDGEQRIICEVETFYGQQLKNLQQQINERQLKYDSESKKWDALIQEKQLRIFQLKKTHERHKETYDERVRLVEEYQHQKAEEQRLCELQLKRLECAIRIQAWWRGTMVRRGLGPFKRKTKKGKKAKKK